jgi:rRNA small subunit pseudouridine methyltransferase Nep1
MVNLVEKERQGRPDIIHLTLLGALGSPLNLEGLLRVYVHTYNNHIITFKPEIRLPRNFNRFIGLMEQLFEKRKVPPEEVLMTLRGGSLEKLLGGMKPKHSLVLT